jgi:muconate cycloisomerase
MLAFTGHRVVDDLDFVLSLKTVDDIVTSKLNLSSGELPLPCGPGLGVELDEEKVQRYRFDA